MSHSSRATTNVAVPESRGRRDATASGRKAALRLGDELLEQARRTAVACHRSVPNQIEYWAALGRHLERALGTRQLEQLLSNESFVERVHLGSTTAPTVDELLAGLEADRASGALAAQFETDAVVYDRPPGSRPSIRRRNADGSVELGTYGETGFVAHPD